MNTMQLSIAEPCHTDWASMQPDEQGRFCSACQKTVIDFTVMNDKEIFATLLKGPADTCGRFTDQQLGNAIKYEEQKRKQWHKYFFSFLVPAFLFTKHAKAQVGKVAVRTTTATTRTGLVARAEVQKHFEFSGTITDAATKEIIAGATIKVKEKNAGTASDAAGKFKLQGTTTRQAIAIIISAIGYETKEISIDVPADNFALVNENIGLNITSLLMGEVLVKSNKIFTTNKTVDLVCITAGGMVMRHTISKYTVIKTKFITALTDSLKIYPNPVGRGSAFTAALKLKKTGNYVLQVVDETGRLVSQQQINAQSKQHNQQIDCNAAWSAGIYFLRVIDNDNRLISTSRFLVK